VTNPKPIPSKADLVRFFEDRAEVVRKATVSLGEGPQWVTLDGATALLDDRSVQASCAADGVRVLAVKVVRRKRHKRQLEHDVMEGLRRLINDLVGQINRNGEQRGRVAQRLTFAENAINGWAEALSGRHRAEVELRKWRDTVTSLFALADEALEDDIKLLDQLADLERQMRDLKTRAAPYEIIHTIYECHVLVQLEARTPTDAEIEFKYRTPCALWRPEHLARLERHGEKATVEWASWGVCWQHTGEDWSDVEVRLSTARPASIANPPDLDDDKLALRKKSAEEKKKIVVQARDQKIDQARGAAAPEMPGVDDGGRPQEFKPAGRFNLPSDGKPVRVEFGRRSLKAKVERVLMPELAQVAHLRATVTWDADTPVLAGPLGVAIGSSMMGRSRANFVAPGSEFHIGFGADEGVRCRRYRQENHERARITGTQTREYVTTLMLSNMSDTPREIVVTERIPISEIDGLEVKTTGIDGWQLDAKDGFITRRVELAPAGTHDLIYRYELVAKSNVELP